MTAEAKLAAARKVLLAQLQGLFKRVRERPQAPLEGRSLSLEARDPDERPQSEDALRERLRDALGRKQPGGWASLEVQKQGKTYTVSYTLPPPKRQKTAGAAAVAEEPSVPANSVKRSRDKRKGGPAKPEASAKRARPVKRGEDMTEEERQALVPPPGLREQMREELKRISAGIAIATMGPEIKRAATALPPGSRYAPLPPGQSESEH